MALVIEDGSIVADADSFVSRADFITYAGTLGVTIADEEATDVLLRKAFDFINEHEPRLKGCRVSRAQLGAYPRSSLWLEGFYWGTDEIPRQAILCQQQLALDLNAGIDIYNLPQSESTPIKRERIEGAVEVEYAVAEAMKLSRNSSSLALLNILMHNNGLTLAVSRW